jgi:hypothetical protein
MFLPTLLSVIGLVAVATLFGSMVFFSAVVAPLTFYQLDTPTAGRYIRSIFPWYYLAILVLSLAGAAALTVARPGSATMRGAIAAGAIVCRQVLMPRINRYRDQSVDGDPSAATAFARLHQLSVWINAAQLLGALTVLVRLGIS